MVGCAATSSLPQSGAASAVLQPYATTLTDAGERLMLDGYDPVAYHALRELRRGVAHHTASFDGVVYYFASAEHRAQFLRTPLRYVPAFGGHCANQMRFGLPVRGDPTHWKLIDGQLWLFSSGDARNCFLMFEAPNRVIAERYWTDEVRGRYAPWRLVWRTLFRVPHYQSLEEQETIWQQSRRDGRLRSNRGGAR